MIMESPRRDYARIAGFLYLVIIFCGIFSEVFIRTNLIDFSDPTATVTHIMANKPLFLLGFVSDLLMLFSDIAIAVLLYALLSHVNHMLSLTAMLFRLVQAVVIAVSLLGFYAVLLLLENSVYIAAFSTEQIEGLVMLMLQMHAYGYDFGLFFFGISNIILGTLLIKSIYFPSIFGYGLIAAAVVYLIGSAARFLAPDMLSMILPFYTVPLVAELAFGLWLLIKGVTTQRA